MFTSSDFFQVYQLLPRAMLPEVHLALLVVPPPKLHHDRSKPADVILSGVGVSVAGKDLLVDAEMKLAMGRKYGLIGRNGIGKSRVGHVLIFS